MEPEEWHSEVLGRRKLRFVQESNELWGPACFVVPLEARLHEAHPTVKVILTTSAPLWVRDPWEDLEMLSFGQVLAS